MKTYHGNAGQSERENPMNAGLMARCKLCGREKSSSDRVWFLLVQSKWAEKVRVIRWDEELAHLEEAYCACSPAHVEELVIHWMITGSLNYPFASTDQSPRRIKGSSEAGSKFVEIDSGDLIGELAVDRESMQRALSEHPGSLGVILEELRSALDREVSPEFGLSEFEEEPVPYPLLT